MNKINLIALLFLTLLLSSCSNEKKEIIKSGKDGTIVNTDKNDTLKGSMNADKKIKIDSGANISGNKNFAVSIINTPVLCSKDFKNVFGGSNGYTLKKSKTGLVKEVEFVAYPGTCFEILNSYKVEDHYIYTVKCDEYDIILGGDSLYIDSRFVKLTDKKIASPNKECPEKDQIFNYFDKSIGALYVWGANNLSGVPEMMKYYPSSKSLNIEDSKTWMLKGVDCSGLLYEATNGYSPRNTYQLVSFGEQVEIKGLTADAIAKIVKPLDLIVWKGHLIIVYDKRTTIQSAHTAGGVAKKDLLQVLRNLCNKRTPRNSWSDDSPDSFVIRRWFDQKDDKNFGK